jgi:DNA-binding XRE family transcriptional regulator
MYHYTESGLLNVYLRNGYEEIDTPYGKAVHISNIDGLHKAIANMLVEQPFLSGREFKFLRTEMDMTQGELGNFFGVSAQRIGQIEGHSRVPGRADAMIRAGYRNLPTRQIPEVMIDTRPERFVEHFHITRAENWRSRNAA